MSAPLIRLAVIGDVHGHMSRLSAVLAHIATQRVDGVLLVGDIGRGLGHGSAPPPERVARFLASMEEVLSAVRSLGAPVAWVPGNHDLPDTPGDGNVDQRVAPVGGLQVAGVGGAGPHRFGFAYEWSEAEIDGRERPDCDVWLSHCPPIDTPLDLVGGSGHHAGSAAIRRIAEAHRGFLVCGHIHEAPGAALINACVCLNAGGLGEPWGRAQVGYIEREGDVDRAIHASLGDGAQRVWSLDRRTGAWRGPGDPT
jgi:Icc-related predicted phosphoesterase